MRDASNRPFVLTEEIGVGSLVQIATADDGTMRAIRMLAVARDDPFVESGDQTIAGSLSASPDTPARWTDRRPRRTVLTIRARRITYGRLVRLNVRMPISPA